PRVLAFAPLADAARATVTVSTAGCAWNAAASTALLARGTPAWSPAPTALVAGDAAAPAPLLPWFAAAAAVLTSSAAARETVSGGAAGTQGPAGPGLSFRVRGTQDLTDEGGEAAEGGTAGWGHREQT